MKKHGATSIARAARGRSVSASADGNSNAGVRFSLGAGNPLNVHVHLPGGRPGASDVRKLIGRGFRSFFDEPTDDQVFRYKGKPIDHTRDLQDQLRKALMKLAYALEGPRANAEPPAHSELDKAGRKNVDPRDNPNIPSGYTYLMQLVAHDIVQSTSSLARTDDGRIALNNVRTAMLRLEAIYNGGPEASPLLYEAGPAGGNAPKSYLRLGPLDTGKAFTCPFRDLARVDLSKATTDVKQRVMDPPPPGAGAIASASNAGASPGPKVLVPLPDVVVGDNRNDDHAILSQLTVVFHLLHNGLVKWADGVPAKKFADNAPEGAIDRYYFARMATTLIYRHIVRHDVMKRLLHPRVYELYAGDGPPKVFDFDGRIPLELTHGAMRVCHTMLRSHYKFNERRGFFLNEVLAENSANKATSMPLPEFWAVAWSNFFDIDPMNREEVNLSSRLRPRYDPQTQVEPLFERFDAMKKPGLAYRDMMAAALAGLWSAPAMMTRLAADASEPELAKVFQKAKLADPAYRASSLRTWLAETCLDGNLRMNDDELDALAQEPPLPFFLMFEAMNDPDSRGLRLGPLGSTIVAAVIFGILDADPITPPGMASLKDQLRYLHENVFGTAVEGLPFPSLDTMAELIQFVASLHGLANATPRFI